ncbi:flavin reductase family protein [Streptomyces hoynatensis]|uniref:Flavin reductase n=1 Tax=Streptomyces hoynatensis TaxID=1141874 RepID=A0A3A9YIJ3_9ACTN|nr:flavin reductase family protein [Streptomyces hoynatensis]RKN36699.1 flavin reductase [Streptomyces hoynatensis]
MDTIITSAEFRGIFASLPTAVAVVTTRDAAGRPTGITTNTVTAVSHEPPLLSVCLDQDSATLAAIRDHGAFAVNFLAETGEGISRVFAEKEPDKFSRLRHASIEGALGGPVFAEDVVAHAECSVHAEVVMGDHSIVVGLIRGGSTHARVPLMYHRREYSSWRPARVAGEPV